MTEEKFEKMMTANTELMGILKETMVSMQRMQADNMAIQKQMLEMTKASLERQNTEQGANSSTPNNDGATFNDSGRQSTRSRVKPSRPRIDVNTDEIGWDIFIDKFNRYKRMAELHEQSDICLELRETCSDAVNKLLYEFIGAPELNSDDLTEDRLLEHIKSVAVKTIHKEVHRWRFNDLTQNDGEPVSQFVGRLKGEATLCHFTVKCQCSKDISYAEEMVSQRLTAGLTNTEHQSKILSEAKDLDTLTKKVHRIMTLETTDDATNKLQNSSSLSSTANVARSQYKKQQRSNLIPQGNVPPHKKGGFSGRKTPRRCRGCGRSDHGPKRSLNRTDCEAFGHKCKQCGKDNHFESVCEMRKSHANFARARNDMSDGEAYESGDADYEWSYQTLRKKMPTTCQSKILLQAAVNCRIFDLPEPAAIQGSSLQEQKGIIRIKSYGMEQWKK